MSMQNPEFIQQVFSSIAPRYDVANHVLSGGLDYLWRAKVSGMAAEFGANRILDVATGSGDLALALKKRLPEAEVIGADFCLPMLRHARGKGLERLVCADGLRLPFADGAFDCVTVAFGLRNMESYPAAIREMARVLEPGGRFMVLDFSLPRSFLRGPYRFYLHHVLPRFAALMTGDKSAYEYLGESIEAVPAGEEMCELLRGNGFSEAACHPLSAGIVSLYVARK
jgi:demethylmenaquinone methyltransferase/2-methoxy-6-polyprenyl-1,4-benzoquinol methylase